MGKPEPLGKDCGEMRDSIAVRLQTGFFERSPYKMHVKAGGLFFQPATKGCEALSIPTAGIESVTFFEKSLKLEIETKGITEVYLTDESDWLAAMKAFRESLDTRIVCEMK